MKCLRIGLLAGLFAVLWMVSTVQGGQREGAFSVSPMVGYHVFEGDQNTDDGPVAGFSVGYNISKRWAAELEARYTDTEADLAGLADEDLEVWSIGMNSLYHFNPDGPFVPYLSAGFGIMYFDNEPFGTDSDYMMNWGMGAKYFISDDFALRADVRHVVDFHSDRDWDRFDDDEIDHNLVATGGIYWQFGGITPPPPPPLDSDQDGIIDIRDKCPDTPLGVMVDAVGCPPKPAEIPKPVPLPPVVEKPAPLPMAKEIITFNLLFGFDKHAITDEMIPVLEQAKLILDEDPAATFIVMGHTCSIGTDEYNQGLSERRAASIRNWLTSNGIAANRLESIGYGESQPKYDNDTREGRKLNRRVEIQTH